MNYFLDMKMKSSLSMCSTSAWWRMRHTAVAARIRNLRVFVCVCGVEERDYSNCERELATRKRQRSISKAILCRYIAFFFLCYGIDAFKARCGFIFLHAYSVVQDFRELSMQMIRCKCSTSLKWRQKIKFSSFRGCPK